MRSLLSISVVVLISFCAEGSDRGLSEMVGKGKKAHRQHVASKHRVEGGLSRIYAQQLARQQLDGRKARQDLVRERRKNLDGSLMSMSSNSDPISMGSSPAAGAATDAEDEGVQANVAEETARVSSRSPTPFPSFDGAPRGDDDRPRLNGLRDLANAQASQALVVYKKSLSSGNVHKNSLLRKILGHRESVRSDNQKAASSALPRALTEQARHAAKLKRKGAYRDYTSDDGEADEVAVAADVSFASDDDEVAAVIIDTKGKGAASAPSSPIDRFAPQGQSMSPEALSRVTSPVAIDKRIQALTGSAGKLNLAAAANGDDLAGEMRAVTLGPHDVQRLQEREMTRSGSPHFGRSHTPSPLGGKLATPPPSGGAPAGVSDEGNSLEVSSSSSTTSDIEAPQRFSTTSGLGESPTTIPLP